MALNKVKFVRKPWGREIHWAVEREYVGKILEVRRGKRLSLQYHRRKKETIYVLEGRVRFTLAGRTSVLGPGKSVTVKPKVRHRVEALADSRLLEASTPQMDDVVRLEDDFGR
jgi:mannose-6-phosphate isomerase